MDLIVVVTGPTTFKHEHPPNQDECQVVEVVQNLKEKAEANPARPPSQLMRDELPAVPARSIKKRC